MSGAVASETFCITDALQRARAHWNAGEPEEARRLCKHVLTAWPGKDDALPLLGVLAYLSGNLDLAIDHLRRASLPPQAPADHWSDLSDRHRRKGLFADAEAAARRAVATNPRLASGWNNLGLALQGVGKLEESRDCFERVVELKPDWAEGHNNLGNVYRCLGLLPHAGWHFIQALALKRDFAEAHCNVASFHIANGESEEAVAAARCAIGLDPRLADAYLNLAEAEMLRCRYSAALEALDALLSFAPGNPVGIAARRKIMKRVARREQPLDPGAGPRS